MLEVRNGDLKLENADACEHTVKNWSCLPAAAIESIRQGRATLSAHRIWAALLQTIIGVGKNSVHVEALQE
jgi:hypothetical protein